MYVYRAYFALIFGFECNIKNFRQTPFYRIVNKNFTDKLISCIQKILGSSLQSYGKTKERVLSVLDFRSRFRYSAILGFRTLCYSASI